MFVSKLRIAYSQGSIRCAALKKSKRPVLGEVYDVRIPQDFGPRSLAKHMQGGDKCPLPRTSPLLVLVCILLTDMVSVAQNGLQFVSGMRLVDGHDVRPLELGPRCLAKRCAGSDLCSSANSAGPTGRDSIRYAALKKSGRPVLGEAYDVRRPQDFGPKIF